MAAIALAVVAGVSATPLPIDRAVADAVHESRLDALDRTWRAIALAGGSAGLGVVVLTSCVLAWRRAGPGWLTFLAGTYAGTQILFWSMKLVVDRPRPPLSVQLATVGSPSYPSGHAAIATAVAAALVVAATRTRRPLVRRSLLPLLVALPLVVGLSRIALGVHWFTDVVGGALLGLGWVLLLTALVLPGRPPPGPLEDPAGGSRCPAGSGHRDRPSGTAYLGMLPTTPRRGSSSARADASATRRARGGEWGIRSGSPWASNVTPIV